MKKSFALVPALALLAIGAATPAFATNARQFMLACDKTPGCNYTVDGNGYVHGTMGDSKINCPPTKKGDCIVYLFGGISAGLAPAPKGSLADFGNTGGGGNGSGGGNGGSGGNGSGPTQPITPPTVSGLGNTGYVSNGKVLH